MSPHSTLKPLRLAAVAMLVALTGSYAQAAEPGIVWVDNESLEFSGCGDAAALPGNQAPSELMNELREQGLANAALMARIRGLTDATITITPISAARHCDGATSSMVLSMTAVERGTGRV